MDELEHTLLREEAESEESQLLRTVTYGLITVTAASGAASPMLIAAINDTSYLFGRGGAACGACVGLGIAYIAGRNVLRAIVDYIDLSDPDDDGDKEEIPEPAQLFEIYPSKQYKKVVNE